MMNRTYIVSVVAAALLGFGSVATAAPLAVKSQGDVKYVSGGAGDEEQRALKDAAKDFNLEITFAATSGNYLSDVDVALVKAGSKTAILQTTTDGPIFLAQVPQGRYEVRATANGTTQTKTVDVGAGRTSTVFHMGPLDKPDPAVAR